MTAPLFTCAVEAPQEVCEIDGSPYDATATKTITIRSEAERGFNVSRLIDEANPLLTALEVARAVTGVSRLNEQNNTDSDAFQAELYLGAIVRMSVFSYDPEEFEKGREFSKHYAELVRMAQKRMGMSDEQLDLLFGTWMEEDDYLAQSAIEIIKN